MFELVRLQAENVTASPVWEGEAALSIFGSATETLGALQPNRGVGRGWRYSIAMTNRHNHLLADLRGQRTGNEEGS